MRTFFWSTTVAIFFVAMPLESGIHGVLTGKVTDSQGQPVIGAVIYVVGTVRGGFTRPNGRFNIDNIEAGKFLARVTGVGYDTLYCHITIRPDDTTRIFFVLKCEVVMTVLGKTHCPPVGELLPGCRSSELWVKNKNAKTPSAIAVSALASKTAFGDLGWKLELTAPEDLPFNMKLADNTGSTVWRSPGLLNVGVNIVRIPSQALSSGWYTLYISSLGRPTLYRLLLLFR